MTDRYNKPEKGTQDWHVPLNENFDRLDVDVEHRDLEANRDNYAPASNAKFFSVDTGAMYLGDGNAWKSANVDRIYDTTDRYLGKLTGSADASTVQDAIQDRTPGAGIVIPDPGFELDWNEQVDLPSDESDFALLSRSRPTINVNSSYSGTAVFNKPAASGRVHNWEIGSFRIEGDGSVLDWALDITDIKNSDIDPWYIGANTPGLILRASTTTTNQVSVHGWRANSQRGPLIQLEGNADPTTGPSVDQCHIYNCFFNQTNNGSGQTAYIDQGANNNWRNMRVEQADIGFLVEGNQVDLHIQDFDRASDGSATVKETTGGGPTLISGLSKENRYRNLDIYHPQTKVVSGVGDPYAAAPEAAAAVDILEPLRRMNGAATPPPEFNENVSGGSINYPAPQYGPEPHLACGSSAGDYAELNTGDPSQDHAFKSQSYPKFAFGLQFDQTRGSSVRAGWYSNDSNYAELIYDPGNRFGVVANTSNINLVTEEGGSVDAVDLGIAPSTSEIYLWSIARVDIDGTDTWVGTIYDGANSDYNRGESAQPVDDKGTIRWRHESDGSNDDIKIKQEKGMRCLRF